MTQQMYPVFYDIETTGLDPMIEPWYGQQTAEVTAVGIGHFPGYPDSLEPGLVTVISNHGDEEYELIEEVLEIFDDVRANNRGETVRVGWNIKQFDDPYFCARAGRLNQDPSPLISHNRLDMMRALTIPKVWWENNEHDGSNKRYPKQDDYARYLGIDFKEGLGGSDMPEAFKNGRYSEIEEHVRDDLNVMLDIFREERSKVEKHYYEHYDIERDEVEF